MSDPLDPGFLCRLGPAAVAESALVLDEFQIKTRTAIRKTPIAISKHRPPTLFIRSRVIAISLFSVGWIFLVLAWGRPHETVGNMILAALVK